MSKPKQQQQAQNEPSRELTAPAAHAVLTPPEMLASALRKGLSVEVLNGLMALQERWQANQAKMAFDNAMADAKAEIKPVKKNRHVGFESRKAGAARTDYMHEDLAAVAEAIGPAFAHHGLSYRFRTDQPATGVVKVTCIITHRDGHSEETILAGPVDTSGNKNPIQQIGSIVTYLQRYTLKAAAGLAAAYDDDGRGSSDDLAGGISPEQIAALKAKCSTVGCPEDQFLNWAHAKSFEAIPADYFESCMAGLDSFGKKH